MSLHSLVPSVMAPATKRAFGTWAAGFLAIVAARPPVATGQEEITVIRDLWGVPHVFASTDQGAMFGAGYAAAEDRLYQMHYNRRAVQGRLAELIGTKSGGMFGTTIKQDENFRHRQIDKYGRRVVGRLDAETRLLLQYYCDGVNHYIDTHRDQLLYLFAGEVPEKWEPADCLGAWNRVSDYFAADGLSKVKAQHEFEELVRLYGLEKAIEMFSPDPIVDEEAAAVQEADVPPETREAMFKYARDHGFGDPNQAGRGLIGLPEHATPKFSHAWVIGGTKTTTGKAVLHSDPQTAIATPAIWHEIHVRGATFDVRGIGVAGCPGLLIGFNGGVAWGLTALGGDTADLFELKMTGANQYEYDGQTYQMEVSEEIIKAKGGRDTPITVRDTILGPVVTPLCQDVQNGEEFIWKALPNSDADRHTMQGAIAMMRATTLASFKTALDLWRHPSTNIVFGDDQGNVGYWVLSAIPVRSAKSPVGGRIAQDGGSSQFAWQDNLPLAVRPHVINPAEGSVWSGNHLPVGKWYPIPLYVGGGGDTVRSWRLAQRIKGVATFTPEDVLGVHQDMVNPAHYELVRAGYHLRDVLHEPLSADALQTLGVLQGWFARGGKSDVNEPYYAAAYNVDINFRVQQAPELVQKYGGGQGGLCYWLKTLKTRIDADPNALLEVPEVKYVDQALAIGWQNATRNYGNDPNQWKARFAGGPGTYRISFFNTLEGYGSLDPTKDTGWPGITTVDINTILSQRGQSYSQWVRMDMVDDSQAILPVGLSEDPTKKHFKSQADLWRARQLRPAPLARARVEQIQETSENLVLPLRGDLNCDETINFGDINPFVLRLGDPVEYRRQYPNCPDQNGDVNRDGGVDFGDINPFVELLGGQ